jgi:TolA-binding protein
LKAFVKQKPTASLLQDAEYMLVSSAYELKDKNRIELLRKYLDRYPDTPYANRIYSLLASCYFYEGKYDEALALFNSTRLDLLGNEERDDRTYQLATCYMKTDNLKEAAIWFETLRASSPKYAKDCSYYLAYIRYTQKRYDEALKDFLPLQDDPKYKELVPYYIAEIYAIKKNYDKAQIVAQNYRTTSTLPRCTAFWETLTTISDNITRQWKHSPAIWTEITLLPAGMHFICWDSPITRQKSTPKQPKCWDK